MSDVSAAITSKRQMFLPGAGFAWAAAHRDRWVINLPHYGAFLFQGTRTEAEEMRAHKAWWEGEVAHLRSASVSDVEGAPSTCWNHRGYQRIWTKTLRGKPRVRPLTYRMYCECGDCTND